MRKFEIGEKVKVIKSEAHYKESDEIFLGATGEVVRHDFYVSDGYIVKFDDEELNRIAEQKNIGFYGAELVSNKLELKEGVKMKKVTKLSQLKAGMSCRTVKDLDSIFSQFTGQEAEIVSIDEGGHYPIKLKFIDPSLEQQNNYNWAVDELEIEVIEPIIEVINSNGDRFIISEPYVIFIGHSYGKKFRGEAKWDGTGEWNVEDGKQIAFSRAVIERETFILDHLCKGKKLPSEIISL